METQEFQKLVLEKFDKIDGGLNKMDGRFDRLTEDFESFREESRAEHTATRTLISQAFVHISDFASHEVRIRNLEKHLTSRSPVQS